MHNAEGVTVNLDSVISENSCAGSVGGINVSTG